MREQVELARHLQHGVAGHRVSGRVPCLLQAEPFRARNRGDAHDVEEGQLPDGGRRQGPDAQPGGLAESDPAPAEAGTQAEAEPEDRDEQDRGLGNNTDGGESGHEEGLGGAPGVQGVGVGRVGTESPDEHAEAGDRDNVIQDRRPHRGPERAVGVEHLGQQGVQPVEEDLRQAPEREGHRE